MYAFILIIVFSFYKIILILANLNKTRLWYNFSKNVLLPLIPESICITSGQPYLNICSYNILAQYQLQNNIYLYSHCKEEYLQWKYRKIKLISELVLLNADVSIFLL